MIKIETDRLLLREPRPEDAEPLLAVFGDVNAMRYVGNGRPRDLSQLQESIRKRVACLDRYGCTLLTVIEQETGEVIGDSGVIPIAWTHDEFELAYRFRPSAWGHGYATEAGRASMAWAWREAKIDQIFGVTMPGNVASQRVLTKLGFDDLGKTDRYYSETLRFFGINRPSDAEHAS